jgi:maltose alpha-D-glucosyltransferase/alpha-amylase
MLTRYLPGATDGWAYALDHARSYLRVSKGTDDGRERTRSEPPREPPNPFTGEAERLGRITRELHEALTSDPSAPGFAPEPVTKRDVERWGSDVRRMVDEGLDLLRSRLSSLDANTAAMARAIAGRGAAVHARVEELEREARREVEVGGRMKVRHHGDYHLGQVLRTSQGDWMIIDFEGEPARPLAERRAPSSPTRDVAGMLRSFAYAAATGIREAGGGGGAGARVNAAAEIGGARWERDVRAAFLSGYGVSGDDPLVALFEMEKVFYELLYELNNRPGWAWIPLRGIARVF